MLMTPLTIPFPNIDPVLIEFGPLAIRWYSLAYIAGLLVGWWYCLRLLKNGALWSPAGPPATRDQVSDLLTWIIVGVIVGGRTGFVLFYNAEYYFANPLDAVKIWEGGMSFHGGMLGVVVALVVFSWKNSIPLLSLSDMIAAVVPIGLFLGRLANFVNGELYGRVADVPWAFVFPHDPSQLPRHPSQLYEAALEGVVLFIVLRFLTHRAKALRYPGIVAGTMLLGYAMARISVEWFREPDTQLGFLAGNWLTMGMVLSTPMGVAGAILIVLGVSKLGPQCKDHTTG